MATKVSTKQASGQYCPDNPDANVDGISSVKPKAKSSPVKQKTSKKKEPGKMGATGRVIELLLERKHTDEEIVGIMRKEYPDRTEKQIKVYIPCQRGDLNAGRKTKDGFNPKTDQITRLVRVNHELIPYSERPETKRKSGKKVDPNDDPLAKIAGLGPNASKKVADDIRKNVKKAGAKKEKTKAKK